MKKISEMKLGEKARIYQIYYDLNDPFSRRLNALGIREGKEIEMVRKLWWGSYQIRVGSTEIVVRPKTINQIWVKPLVIS